jgi:hypothetical protein
VLPGEEDILGLAHDRRRQMQVEGAIRSKTEELVGSSSGYRGQERTDQDGTVENDVSLFAPLATGLHDLVGDPLLFLADGLLHAGLDVLHRAAACSMPFQASWRWRARATTETGFERRFASGWSRRSAPLRCR